jgi:hypothetical protein
METNNRSVTLGPDTPDASNCITSSSRTLRGQLAVGGRPREVRQRDFAEAFAKLPEELQSLKYI